MATVTVPPSRMAGAAVDGVEGVVWSTVLVHAAASSASRTDTASRTLARGAMSDLLTHRRGHVPRKPGCRERSAAPDGAVESTRRVGEERCGHVFADVT